jgi:hypothetical protein
MISQGSQDLMELSSDGFPCHRDSQHSLRQHELSDLHTIFTFTEFGHSYSRMEIDTPYLQNFGQQMNNNKYYYY